jgi:hypothetical protein
MEGMNKHHLGIRFKPGFDRKTGELLAEIASSSQRISAPDGAKKFPVRPLLPGESLSHSPGALQAMIGESLAESAGSAEIPAAAAAASPRETPWRLENSVPGAQELGKDRGNFWTGPRALGFAAKRRAAIVCGMRYISFLGLALAIGFAGLTVGSLAASAGELLPADTALAMASGATFTAPMGWRLTSDPHKNVLEPPEADSHLALLDVRATDAAAALAAGWASYRSDAKRPLRISTPQAPYNGWEERRLYSYETSPNEKAVVYALAWRAGQDWTVVIVEASRSTFEKRNAAFSLTIGSLRPKGYQRERFTDRKAHPLDAERISLLKEFVRSVMQEFSVPGVGLSLIDDGKVVFQGGLGVRTLDKPDPVDADTLFLAASNTKAMTTLLLAELVDEGKVRWDEPVAELYPDFRLGDPDTTPGARKALGLRVHWHAPPGSRVAVQFRDSHAPVIACILGHHAADQPVWRSLPIQQSHGGRRGLRWGFRRQPGAGAGRRL